MTVTAAARMSTASHRTGITAGWLIGGLTSVLLIAALVLDVRTGSYQQLLYLAIAGALTCLGALLTTRMPEHPISWGFARQRSFGRSAAVRTPTRFEALVAHPGSLPGGRLAAWVDNWFWLPGLVLPMSLLLLVVPDGRLLSLRWRLAVVAVVGGTALASAGLSGSPTFELGSAEPIENPLALDPGVWHVAAVVGFALLSVAVIASLVSFVLRFPARSAKSASSSAGSAAASASGSASVGSERSRGASFPTRTSSTRSRCSRFPSAPPSRSSNTGCTSSTSSSTAPSSMG